MTKIAFPLTLLATVLVGSLPAASAQASQLAFRTWVSGAGSDNNPCTRTEPCATFQRAAEFTANEGEIDALDPGDFGAVTIPTALTIDGGGQGASLSCGGTSQDGILVSAPAGQTVILRNLRITGGLTCNIGIAFVSGAALYIENCHISEFDYGILAQPNANASLFVTDTTVDAGGDDGIALEPISASYFTVSIVNSRVMGNANGVALSPSGGAAVVGVIDRSTINLNVGNGITVSGVSYLALTDSSIVGNATSVANNGAGVVSYKNNRVISITGATQAFPAVPLE